MSPAMEAALGRQLRRTAAAEMAARRRVEGHPAAACSVPPVSVTARVVARARQACVSCGRLRERPELRPMGGELVCGDNEDCARRLRRWARFTQRGI